MKLYGVRLPKAAALVVWLVVVPRSAVL